MQFGVRLVQSPTDVAVILRRAELADALGYHSVWLPDHLHWPRANASQPGTSVETLTMMSAVAARTGRVQLGFTMLNPGFRPPAVLAKMLATIDQISQGRLLFSLGAGWFRTEYEAYGLPFLNKAARYEYEREVALAILELWTRPTPEMVSFDGTYIQLRDIQFSPPPFRQPHPPLWFGGDSAATQAMVAELGDGWLMTAQRYEQDLREFRERFGDFSRPLRLATQLNTCVATSRADALSRSEQAFALLPPDEKTFDDMLGHALIGAADDCIKLLEPIEAAGIDLVLLLVADEESMTRFASDVMPRFTS